MFRGNVSIHIFLSKKKKNPLKKCLFLPFTCTWFTYTSMRSSSMCSSRFVYTPRSLSPSVWEHSKYQKQPQTTLIEISDSILRYREFFFVAQQVRFTTIIIINAKKDECVVIRITFLFFLTFSRRVTASI